MSSFLCPRHLLFSTSDNVLLGVLRPSNYFRACILRDADEIQTRTTSIDSPCAPTKISRDNLRIPTLQFSYTRPRRAFNLRIDLTHVDLSTRTTSSMCSSVAWAIVCVFARVSSISYILTLSRINVMPLLYR